MFKTILVPTEIQSEINDSDLSTIEKTVVYWLVWRCGILRHRGCPIHQRTLDVAIGQRHRMAVIRFIRASKFIQPALKGLYRPHRQSIRYTITGVEAVYADSVEPAQHKSDIGVSLAWVGAVEFREVDFAELFEGVTKAWELFGWDTSKLFAEWGISQIDEPDLTMSEVRCLVDNGERSEESIEQQVDVYQRFMDDPAGGVFRKDGRVYSRLTSLPESVRTKVIRFGGEQAGSVDLSCCYVWILAAEHRQWLKKTGEDLSQVDAVLNMIGSRTFYKTIAEKSGIDEDVAKRSFATFCLFGPIGFHPMWHALRSMCPGICRTVEWWRKQQGGATHLAHYLQRAEGALMTDGVVHWLTSNRIPVVQVHDGCYVPREAVDSAVQYLKKRSVELFGTECFVKTAA